jgi:hypothetical protein
LIEKSEKRKTSHEDAEEIRQVLSAVSTEVPALIKSIIGSVFSEEAGKSMGRAAAAFYKELKESGMPDDVAVKMTEDYMGVFTSLGDILKKAGKKGGPNFTLAGIKKQVKKETAEERREEEEQE